MITQLISVFDITIDWHTNRVHTVMRGELVAHVHNITFMNHNNVFKTCALIARHYQASGGLAMPSKLVSCTS